MQIERFSVRFCSFLRLPPPVNHLRRNKYWHCLLTCMKCTPSTYFFQLLQTFVTVQFSSVMSDSCSVVSDSVQLCPTLCDSKYCSMPGFPVYHQLPEFTQTHVHWVGDAIQPSHPLLSPFPPAFNLSQHQGLFKWVSSSHQVAKVLELQLQHQPFQWTPRTDLV